MAATNKISTDKLIKETRAILLKARLGRPFSDVELELIDDVIRVIDTRKTVKVGKAEVILLSNEVLDASGSAEGPDDESFVTTKTVADYFKVTTETVRDWIEKGQLSGRQIRNRGRYKIPKKEFEYLAQKDRAGIETTEEVMEKVLGHNDTDWEFDFSDDGEGKFSS